MKTKEELKKYFENGDIPVQEEFWEWQESYWHKDEKIPADKLDYDLSQKADANASNLSPQNTQLWKDKIETQTTIQAPQLNGNVLTVFYTGENGVQQSKSVDLSSLVTRDINIENAVYDASQNIITIIQNDGSAFHINLSEFSIIPATNSDGSVTLSQEGQEKVTLKKVAVTGSYNDLSDKPSFSGNDNLQNVIDRNNGTTKPIIFQPGEGRAGEINFSPTTYSLWFGNMNTDHTGTYGIGIGYNTLPKLTTGLSDIAIGGFAGANLTTGDWNTLVGVNSGSLLTTGSYNVMIGTEAGKNSTSALSCTYVGDESGVKNIDGKYNTALGVGAGYWLTHGVQNTFLGAYAGQTHGKVTTSGAWGSNTFIGYNAASTTHAMGVWGDNNVVIGCNAPLGGSTFNKLVIESNPVARRHDFVTPLIGGDFAARTLDFDAVVSARRTPLADNTYTKVAVLNAGNVFGYKNLSDFTDFVPLTGTSGTPVTGNIQFTNEDSTERLLYRINEPDRVKSALGLFSESVMMFSGDLDGTNVASVDVSKENGVFAFGHGSHLMLNDAGASLRQTNGGTVKGIFVSSNPDEPVFIEHETINSRGLSSKTYFGDNAQENDYIQKQYADKQHSYSTKEELTGGKWINGKPVYKKTLYLDQIPRTGEIDLKTEFPDLETIISNEMFTEWYDLKTAFAGNQWRTKAYITIEREMAIIELLNVPDYDYSRINSFTLTLEYTKK
ncbi:hypothetical protein SAMN06265171_102324 [Chryseobacterium rhizoplanae]|uniref:Peptidase S74 domain-containing protein n=1 Tax=Chryseobacterium rhizoplanae TaxID=1609531 RepID=A0A521BZK1_9FLAO|nr:hypothetical protein [Chryseobacterium rhizoplanae]SMO52629.1 hypothetical protein SAMN06265171_102324 [Chryseobacterium rhizoplanae]